MMTNGVNLINNIVPINAGNVDVSANPTKSKLTDSFDFQSTLNNASASTNVVDNDVAKVSNDSNQAVDAAKANVSNGKAERTVKSEDTKEAPDDKIDNMYEKVRDVIKKKLGITDEELDEALNNLSMTMADMLEPGNVMQLMMELSGVDNPLEIVTDASMSEMFKAVTTEIGEIVSDTAKAFDMSDKQLTDLAKEYDENTIDFAETFVVEEKTYESDVNTDAESEEEITYDDKSNQNNTATAKKTDNTTNAFEQVVTKLDEAVTEVFEADTTLATSEVDVDNILRQINEAVRVNMTPDSTTMELQLNPQNLGRVNIQVVAKDGVITANITTQDEMVRRAVEAQVVSLKETLNNQGIKVEAVEVTIASHGFETNGENNGNSDNQQNNGRHSRRMVMEDDFSADINNMEEEITSSPDSTVNFRA